MNLLPPIPKELMDALDDSLLKLERMTVERDEERGNTFDTADDQGAREDRAYDDWRQRTDDEREEILEGALDECLQKGVSREALKTLARETGAVRWALEKSLKA